jgi:iron complex outermembrane recepter protein
MALARADDSHGIERQPITIAPQTLAAALQNIARARALQLVYRSELVENRHTGGVDGNLTSDEALSRLLNGTGLTFLYLSDRAITIVPNPTSATHPAPELDR